MSSQKFITVLVIFSSLLVAYSGAAPSSLNSRETRSAEKTAKGVKEYIKPSGVNERRVVVTNDRIEVVVADQKQEASVNQTAQELKDLREANKALDKRVRALEAIHGDGELL